MADLRLRRKLIEQPEVVEVTQQYYTDAQGYLGRQKFANKTEEKVWQLHSEGMSQRDIAKQIRWPKELSERGRDKRVRSIIEKHQALAEIKPPPNKNPPEDDHSLCLGCWACTGIPKPPKREE